MTDVANEDVGPRKSLFQQTTDQNGKVTVLYEKQTAIAPGQNEPEYTGELRGYYPDKSGGDGNWYPRYSTKGGRSPTPAHPEGTHDGIDIYAPFFEYPLETPIYAMVSGTAAAKSNALVPNDLGNRIWLWPKDAGNDTRYMIGHLNRLRGRFSSTEIASKGRPVKKGELIGYAGHSGNADDQREASSVGAFNVNAGHVHLKWVEAGAVGDAALELGWKLRFNTPAEHGPFSLATYKQKGYLLPEKISKSPAKGLLACHFEAPVPLPWNAPATELAAPFELIEVDNAKALRVTEAAYALMRERLAPGAANANYRERGVKRYQGDINDKEVHEKKGATKDPSRLYLLFDDMKKRAADFKSVGKSGEDCSSDLMYLLLDTYQALYLLMGGRSLHKVARKLATSETGAVVDCGIGPGGQIRALSAGHGQAAVQHVRLPYRNAGNEVVLRETLTLGVTFGAGTEWHAILDQTILATLADSTKYEKFVRELVVLLFRLAETATFLFDLATRHISLIRNGRNASNTKRFEKVDQMVDAIVGGPASVIGEILPILPELTKSDAAPAVEAMLRQISEKGAEALGLASKAFQQGNQSVPRFVPQLGKLWLEPFPATQN